MKRFLLFVVLNFGALFLGAQLMGNPAENQWYQHVHKAPWTPPGWLFGVAWFTIMALFSVFLARNFQVKSRIWWFVYTLHLMLNISWNPLFFQWHWVIIGMFVLTFLFITVSWFLWEAKTLGDKFMLLPYFLWLIVAGSLNAYIWIFNA